MSRTMTVAAVSAGVLALEALVTFGPTAQAAVEPSSRAGLTPTNVSIRVVGQDLSGRVRSERRVCMRDREVLVYKVRGERGGGDDRLFARDNAQMVDGVGRWSTGNTATPGSFYAKVRKTSECAADASRTVRVDEA